MTPRSGGAPRPGRRRHPRRPWWATLVPAVACAALGLGLGLGPAAEPATAQAATVQAATVQAAPTRPSGPLTVPQGAFLGAVTNPDRSTADSTPTEVAAWPPAGSR